MAEPLSNSQLTTMTTPDPTLGPTTPDPTLGPTVQAERNFMGVPIPPPNSQLDGGYAISITRYTAGGGPSKLTVHLPQDTTPEQLANNPMLLAAVLKDGDPVWSGCEMGFVLVAAFKAARLGLDLFEGDIYPIEGRLGISDWAKIKYARSHGYHAEVAYTVGAPAQWPWNTKNQQGVWNGTADSCVVRVLDRSDKVVSTYETTLKAWWEGRSPEWRNRPAESLRRKALARAYQEVCPLGVDPEEAPPLAPPLATIDAQETIGAKTAMGMQQAMQQAQQVMLGVGQAPAQLGKPPHGGTR